VLINTNEIYSYSLTNPSPEIFEKTLSWQPFDDDIEYTERIPYNSVISVSDLAGNVSSETLPLYFDLTPPSTFYISFSGEYFTTETETYTYRNTYTRFMIKAEDDFSGIKNIEYSFDDLHYVVEDSFYDTFPLTNELILYYKAADLAGNTVKKSKNIILDNIAPVNNTSPNTSYINLNTLFTFSGSDDESGLRSGYYKIDNSNWYELNISSSFKFCNSVIVLDTNNNTLIESIYPDDGWHRLTTKLEDNVGNQSDTISNTIFFDTKSPEIEFITKNFTKNDSGIYVISPNNTIPFKVIDPLNNDTASGILNLSYKIDEENLESIINARFGCIISYIIKCNTRWTTINEKS